MPADREALERVARAIEPDATLTHLGSGGFASTFRVDRDDDLYALKIVDPAVADPARVARELGALQRVDHEGVVHFRDFGTYTDEGTDYQWIAMDFVEGQSLARNIDGGVEFTPAEAMRIVRSLVAAAAAIWDQNTAHRDLSPNNIMLKRDNVPVIVDLGMARHVDDVTMTVLPTPGTPGWMSPEQVGASPQHGDKRSDQFVLGCIAYLLLTGISPFTGATAWDRFQGPALQTPRTVRTVAPDVPSVVSDVVARMMAKQPHKRYLRTDALLEDLDRAVAALSAEGARATHPQEFYLHISQHKGFAEEDDFLAELRPTGVIIDVHQTAKIVTFLDLAREHGHRSIVDPATPFARSPEEFRPVAFKGLPYGNDPVLTGFSSEAARVAWCRSVLDAQMIGAPEIAISPYFYAGEGERNWLEESLACARVYADLMPELGVAAAEVWTGVSVHSSWLANDTQRDVLLNLLTGQPMMKLYLLVATTQQTAAPLAEVDVLRGLRELIDTMRDAGVPTVVGKRASSGLLLLALGAEGWGTGVAGNLMNSAQHPLSKERGGQGLDRIFVPSLLNMITVDTYVRMRQQALERVPVDTKYADLLLSENPDLETLTRPQRQLLLRHNLTAEKRLVDDLAVLPMAKRVGLLRNWVDAATEHYAALPPTRQNGEDGNFLPVWRSVLR
jgi:serine/threonine protein kinase